MPGGTDEKLVESLRSSLRGEVIDRSHAEYDEARKVWNGLIDRRPAVIARCADTTDVVEAVRVAREQRPVVSIRGGGHQVAGSAVCDDGLVIDLSQMNGVEVDESTRTARVQGGARWADVDRETQRFGLATVGGEVSITGVAGLTLGGGLGALMRAHGLSCDNLRSVEIVTADGTVRTASRDEHPDLLWAARGGGRGLGVVTSFEFDLHPIGPEVAVATVVYAYEDAEPVLRASRDVALDAPDSVTPEFGVWSVPPDPEIPEEMHGMKVVIVGGMYAGPADEAGPVLAPFKELGTPLADFSATMPYVAAQNGFDALFPDGGRYYWKSHFMDELNDDAIATIVERDRERATGESAILIRTLGGAISRVDADETAFAHRSAGFNVSVDSVWFDPALDQAAIGWARSTWDALRPFSSGVYMNFAGLDEDAGELRSAIQGSNEQRLADIRASYDPEELFEVAAHRL